VFASLARIKIFVNLMEKIANYTLAYRKPQILINAILEFNIVKFKLTMFAVNAVMD
jgi:hypothetical protein